MISVRLYRDIVREVCTPIRGNNHDICMQVGIIHDLCTPVRGKNTRAMYACTG